MRPSTMTAYLKRRHELWAALGQLELKLKDHEKNVMQLRKRASTQDVADIKHVGAMLRGLAAYLDTFGGGAR